MTKIIKSAVVFFVIFLSSTLWAANFPELPKPFHYVNDFTNTLDTSEKQALENKIIAYSKETSSQIAVVLVPTTGEYGIAEYAFELGDKWGIGRKNLDNGVLMLIAVNDHKLFIATGKGLEGALPDALLSQIIRTAITPEFKHSNYALGISNGLDHILAASKGEYAAYQTEEDISTYLPFLIFVLIIIFIILNDVRGSRSPYVSQTRRTPYSRRSNSHFGGGFGSGGFGGGSGGGFGGGGFGGGGAGGSW